MKWDAHANVINLGKPERIIRSLSQNLVSENISELKLFGK